MISVPSADDVTIALHDLGGAGPPLVVLHATGFHGRCYQPLAEHLGHRFHVYAPDLRGHGDSTIPIDTGVAWEHMATDTLAVLDHLGLDEPVRFVGHSMGGATVALAELRRPGTVRAAWLYEPILFPPDPGLGTERANPLADLARRRKEHFESYDAAFANYAGKAPFARFDPAALRAYVDHGFAPSEHGITLKCRGEQEARVFEGVDTTVFERLGDVEPPVVVVGSGDGEGPAVVAPMVADALADGRFVSWPDHSHFGPFEDPARVAAAVIGALS